MSDKNIITFKEDPDKGFVDLYNTAQYWIDANKDSIKVLSGEYGVYKCEDGSHYHRSITIAYTGESAIANPQECDHANTEDVILMRPSCVAIGSKIVKCKQCGMQLRKVEMDTIPHNFNYVRNNDETCTKDGTETGTCDMCGKKLDRVIEGSLLGHDYVFTSDGNATCELDGTETGVCSRCKNVIHQMEDDSALGHDMPDEWTTRTEATLLRPGEKYKRCRRCNGNEITEEIPKLTIDLEIISTVNAMLIDQPFSQTLKTNIPDQYESLVNWNIENGTLPSGLSFNQNGLLSGTPNTSGVYSFTVKATFNNELSVSKLFTVNIANRMLTVTFDPNGGTCNENTRLIAEGSLIGELPVPTFDGMNFGGWFTAPVDGLKIDANFTVSTNVTFYARWGESSEIEFGDATTQFNIGYKGDRTNYQNNPYDFYSRYTNGNTSNLTIQTGISSQDRSNNMSDTNKEVKLYMKVTNNGASGNFDIGFDCDSYITGNGDDKVRITRLEKGVSLGNPVAFTVTVDYDTSIWLGKYSERTDNRYNNMSIDEFTDETSVDSGYAFTMNDIFINSGSYTILEVTFKIP